MPDREIFNSDAIIAEKGLDILNDKTGFNEMT